MSRGNRYDKDMIIKIFNDSGNKAAMEYIELNYGIKYPRDVLKKIMKSPGYSYDATNRKITANNDKVDGSIFMGIDELCKPSAPKKLATEAVSSTCNKRDSTLETLYHELMQEKFIELNKYISLDRYSNTISIDKTALIANGYLVAMH